jgi:hypothetical protein
MARHRPEHRVGFEVYCKLKIHGNGNGNISCALLLPDVITQWLFPSSPPSLHTLQTRVCTAALFPRSGGRAVDWPSAYATSSPNRSRHYFSPLSFYRFPLLLCDWPTLARSPFSLLIGVGTLSSAPVAL